MSVKVKGRVIVALPETSGTSKSGNAWRKLEYVLETEGQYPKKIAFSVMNDKIEALNLYVGAVGELSVDIESREYNGRWYTSVSAFAFTPTQAPQAQPQPAAPAPPAYGQPAPAPASDDLPY